MKLGELDIKKLMLGDSEVSKAYLGEIQVYGGSSITYLEYISNGEYVSGARSEQSINLNYYPTEATRAVITLNMPEGEGNICFGSYKRLDNSYWRLFSFSGQKNKMVFDIPTDGGYRQIVSYTWGTKATFEMGYAYLKNLDNGQTSVTSNPTRAHNWIYPLQLWRVMDPADFQGCTGTKIYSIDIYEGETKTMELRPALVNGEAGLWDNIGKQFYGNVGEGTITYQ